MSAAGRGPRLGGEHDYYPTPAWCVHRLLEAWSPPPGLLVEPAAGDGAIIRALKAAGHWVSTLAIDVRPETEESLRQEVGPGNRVVIGDFLSPLLWTQVIPAASLVITNPPFSLAEQFIRRSRTLCPNAEIVMLLRQGFLSSKERRPLYDEIGPPDLFPLPDRPQFISTASGGDNTDYAWFAWPPGPPRKSGRIWFLKVTPLADRKERTGRRPKKNDEAQASLLSRTS